MYPLTAENAQKLTSEKRKQINELFEKFMEDNHLDINNPDDILRAEKAFFNNEGLS